MPSKKARGEWMEKAHYLALSLVITLIASSSLVLAKPLYAVDTIPAENNLVQNIKIADPVETNKPLQNTVNTVVSPLESNTPKKTETTELMTSLPIKKKKFVDEPIPTVEGVANSTSCGDVLQSLTITQNIGVNGTCFTILTSNIVLNCAGFTITGNQTGMGVNASNVTNVTINNCRIQNFQNGIYLSGASQSSINNNTLTNASYGGLYTTGSSSNTVYNNNVSTNLSVAIAIVWGSDNNVLVNNNGVSDSNIGLLVALSQGNNLTGNNGTSNSHNGIALVSTQYNTLKRNIGTSTTYRGMSLGSSNQNTFYENRAITNSYKALEFFTNSVNNTFVNTTLRTNSGWLTTDSGSMSNYFAETIFDSNDGSIKILPSVTLPASAIISLSNLNVSYNRTYLNSNVLPFLNTTAVITLNGISLANPKPVVDFEDDGSYVDCPASICQEISYSGGVFVFDVTHFTAYASDET